VELDPLSPLARRYFSETPRAGTFPPGTAGVISGEAGRRADGAHVRFHLRVEGETVKDARFQAYGCPHTLAAAAWVAEQLPGRRLSALVPGTPEQWLQALAAPVEKLGRMLVVEDALAACVREAGAEVKIAPCRSD
jgi:NifU-like protein involved in Fe-S cluster formation